MGMFLIQQKYTHDLIRKFHIHNAKPIHTLCLSQSTLTLIDGELLADPSEYWSMVGALQHVTMMRPDITFVVHVIYQFMHAPHTTHMQAIK